MPKKPKVKDAPRVASEADREIGARIRAHRLAAGLTQESVAGALGVSFQQVQKYETGKNRVPTARLVTIAELIGVTPTLLATGHAKDADDAAAKFLGLPEAPRLIAAFMQLNERERAAALAVVEAMASVTK